MNEKENFLQKYFPLNNLFFLLIIFSIGLIIRLYYLPFDLPIILDGESYFWYANDMSILGQLPTDFNSHNNFWSTILSLFFTINPSNNILDYMNLQRILSVVISTVTIFPMFFLCKKFFSNNYAIIGASFFILDPRIIMNSLLGITEPIYFLIGILIILFSLNKNIKFYYIAFGLAAIFSLIRYEGLIILVPLTITYFWKFKINKKSILKYGICFLVFIIIITPMVESRIQATGQDGLTSHILGGTNYVSNTLSGTYEKQDRSEFFIDGILNSIKYLGWVTIPIWIIFLPYGVLKYFKKLDSQKSTILLFSAILILPAIYAYSRDIPETRYLYILFPLFSIISLYLIKKICKGRNYKLIFSFILSGIVILSIGWMEYKSMDVEYEKEAFMLSFKIKEITKGVNEFYPESTYLKFVNVDKKFPKLKNEINDQHKIFPLPNYEKIDDLLSNERNNGLTHIITDKSQNPKSQRNEFLVEIFENEYEYEFLKKIYDSKKDGFRYHLKIFEIDYEIFDQHKKTNEKILN
jgi:hypothetical protein